MKDENLEEKNKKMTSKFDIKGFITDNKKMIGVSIVAFLFVVVVIVGSVALFGKKNDEASMEEKLTARLKELTEKYYEASYYPGLQDPNSKDPMTDEGRKELIKRFKDTGITFSLKNIAVIYKDDERKKILEDFKDGDNTCDYDNTKVVIYPKEPYGVKDYEIKISLSCDFLEKNK